jgi:hypothetical protein
MKIQVLQQTPGFPPAASSTPQVARPRQKRSYTLASLLALIVLSVGATPALAETTPSPWWGITTGSRPTNLVAGVGKSSVLELSVGATSGWWFFGKKANEEFPEQIGRNDFLENVLPFNATARQVQRALEGSLPASMGETVSGGPVDTATGRLIAASSTVEDFTTTGGAFAVGQEVFSTGVAQGTTITNIGGPGGTTITLSSPATETRKAAVLSSAPAPYLLTFPDQSAPLFKAQSFAEFTFECGSLEGHELGSCEGEPERIFKELAGGPEPKPQPQVTQKAAGAPDGELVVEAENLGDAPSSGPVTVTDTLPEGLTALAAEGIEGSGEHGKANLGCAIASSGKEVGKEVTCTFAEGSVPAYQQIEILISVRVEPDAHTGRCEPDPSACEKNEATVSGGGAAGTRTATHTIEVEGKEKFGIENYSIVPESPGGKVDTQAGSHPFQLTTVVTANSAPPGTSLLSEGKARTVALVKDNVAELPAGFVGNPTPIEQCTDAQFSAGEIPAGINTSINQCPASSAVGVALIRYSGNGSVSDQYESTPIFNMVPLPGEPARFGFRVGEGGLIPVFLNASVRTGGDYGVTISSHNIIQTSWLLSAKLTFWGVPGSKAHDNQRGWECLDKFGSCPTSTALTPPPFLIMPTSCEEPWVSTLHADSWPYEGKPSEPAEPFRYELPYKLDGCNHLPFSPSIEVTPDLLNASTSTGLNVDVHVPQTAELNPEGLAESSVKTITVALPPGVAVNPSAGNGVGACSERLVGYEPPPVSNPPEELHFTSRLPGSFGSPPGELLEPGINFCANASKIAKVNIHSPLLKHELEGAVYLATQNQNPFGSLLAMYIVAEDPVSGTLVKLPGQVSLCHAAGETIAGQTCGALGQLITTFQNSPELPFEDAVLHFYGGERAPLATPSRCGAYTTNAAFVPWAAEANDEAEVTAHSSSTFDIEHGPGGGACPGASLPFSPTLTGGALNVNAGAFSPFTATMSRKDGEQNLQSLEVHLPPGLSGILTGVELCPEPQANLGECGPNSLIGETTVSVGVGGDPYSVSGGKFYLTGPYNGSGSCTVGTSGCAPFGITFEVPAKAGPFDLERNSANPAGEDPCDCVIVRGKIEINPLTSAVTITSNPPGTQYAIPTSIEGIPLEIQHINAITTRNNFQFNPTNCSKMEVSGTIHSSEGGIDTIGVPFQVTNCRSLGFTPKFKVSVGAKTSKADGASLSTTVTEPAGSLGTQSNLARVKVELPRDLPSRLTTLQKACTSKQFELNPANCPKESKIGYAKVITPLVPVPLEGPAIFVSHGGEAFPSLTMVLQGYGVTIDLVGTTFISKSGVTSTTFKTVPDQPFNSFALTLPTGKYSALTALGNVCAEKLSMPTEFIAQNGAEIHQTTPIGVTGCGKTLTRSQELKAALKACRKKDKHDKAKRQVCDQLAHRKFGPLKKSKKK